VLQERRSLPSVQAGFRKVVFQAQFCSIHTLRFLASLTCTVALTEEWVNSVEFNSIVQGSTNPCQMGVSGQRQA